MQIDSCLILSAGHGTRMGPIGEVLPKPLWPIFESTILELQINYAREMGVKKIFVNGFHQAKRIKDYLDKNKLTDIIFLHEQELLGVGGAVHNVKNYLDSNKLRGINNNLLILNGDQFLFPTIEQIKLAETLLIDSVAVLFSVSVSKLSLYNKLFISNNRLVDIKQNDLDQSFFTYSGQSIINLNLLDKHAGYSNFFDTVANCKSKNIGVVNVEGVDYWDVGTIQRYFESCFKLLRDNSSELFKFCRKYNAFASSKFISDCSYGTINKKVINLTSSKLPNESTEGIILLQGPLVEMERPGVCFDNIVSYLE